MLLLEADIPQEDGGAKPLIEVEPIPEDPLDIRIAEAIASMDTREQVAGLMVVTIGGMNPRGASMIFDARIPVAGFSVAARQPGRRFLTPFETSLPRFKTVLISPWSWPWTRRAPLWHASAAMIFPALGPWAVDPRRTPPPRS